MKRILILAFLLTIVTGLLNVPVSLSANGTIPSAVVVAAQEGMKLFLRDYKSQNLQHFGFLNQKEVEEAVLGEGFRVFAVLPEYLLNEGMEDLAAMAVPTNMWKFLINTGDKAVALLTVDFTNGKWTAIEIGSSGLAKQLQKFIEAWPGAKGYHFRFLRVYQATSDFLELSQREKILGFVPLTSGRITLDLKGGDFDPLDLRNSLDIVTTLRPIVKKHLTLDK